MAKLKLSIESLTVESFRTGGGAWWRGTVAGRATTHPPQDPTTLECQPDTITDCASDPNQGCTLGNPCTWDPEATLDVVTCAESMGTACGTDATIGATTCGHTNICCGFSKDRTMACCAFTTNC